MTEFFIQKHGIPKDVGLTHKIYQQTVELIKAIFPSLTEEETTEIFEVTFACIYKLGAIKYHHDNFLKEWDIKFEIIRGQKNGKHIEEESTLAYELEAFIFQIKSCLDAVVKIFKPLTGIVLNRYGDYGQQVTTALNNNLKNDHKPRAERLITLIERNSKWIRYLVDVRDMLYHHLHGVRGLHNFFFLKTDKPESLIAPRLFDGSDARLLTENAWRHISLFIVDFMALSIYIRINPVFKLTKVNIGFWVLSLNQKCISEN